MLVSSNHSYSAYGRKLDHHVVSREGMAFIALREGLPNNILKADGASTTRNLAVVVAWHGGSPKVSTSCIEPKGDTFSPEKLRKWVLTGSSFSLPMSILSKAKAKMMSAELPLSTRTR